MLQAEGGTEALHVNRVYLSGGPGGEEREPLRVSVEITHPALALAVHRTWTGEITHPALALAVHRTWTGDVAQILQKLYPNNIQTSELFYCLVGIRYFT